MAVLKEKYGIKDPPPLNPHTEGMRDQSRYCDFHQNYSHSTEYCCQMKKIIESLKRRGLLAEFMKESHSVNIRSLKEKRR